MILFFGCLLQDRTAEIDNFLLKLTESCDSRWIIQIKVCKFVTEIGDLTKSHDVFLPEKGTLEAPELPAERLLLLLKNTHRGFAYFL